MYIFITIYCNNSVISIQRIKQKDILFFITGKKEDIDEQDQWGGVEK